MLTWCRLPPPIMEVGPWDLEDGSWPRPLAALALSPAVSRLGLGGPCSCWLCTDLLRLLGVGGQFPLPPYFSKTSRLASARIEGCKVRRRKPGRAPLFPWTSPASDRVRAATGTPSLFLVPSCFPLPPPLLQRPLSLLLVDRSHSKLKSSPTSLPG